MRREEYRIRSGDETLACTVDFAAGTPAPSVISLHGGGPSSRLTTEYLGTVLANAGRSVVRFDHSGQGDSTGTMAASSLEKRLQEAVDVVRYFGMDEGMSVIGSSMGGYVGTRLVSETNGAKLVLFCPAAYATAAWKVSFGNGFTDIIRKKESFLETDVVETVKDFHGDAILVMGMRDEIIPSAVVELYKQGLSRCRRFKSFFIEECPHPIHRWVISRPAIRQEIERRVLEVLT